MSEQRHPSVSSAQVEIEGQETERKKTSGSVKGSEDWPTLNVATQEDDFSKSMSGKTQKVADRKQKVDTCQARDNGDLSHLPEMLSPSGGNRKVPKNSWKKVDIDVDYNTGREISKKRHLEWREDRRSREAYIRKNVLRGGHRRGGVPDANRNETERYHRGHKEEGTKGDGELEKAPGDAKGHRKETGDEQQQVEQQQQDYWYFDDTSNGYYYQHSGSQGWKKNRNNNNSKVRQPSSNQQHQQSVGQQQSTTTTTPHSPIIVEERANDSTSPHSEEQLSSDNGNRNSSSNMTANNQTVAQQQLPTPTLSRPQHNNNSSNNARAGGIVGGGGGYRGRRSIVDEQSQQQHQSNNGNVSNYAVVNGSSTSRPHQSHNQNSSGSRSMRMSYRSCGGGAIDGTRRPRWQPRNHHQNALSPMSVAQRRARGPLPDWDEVQEVGAEESFDYMDLLENQYSQYYALSSVPPFDPSLSVGVIAVPTDANAAAAAFSTGALPNYIQQLQRIALTTFRHPSGYVIAQPPLQAAASLHQQQQSSATTTVSQPESGGGGSLPESALPLQQPLNILAHPTAVVPSATTAAAHANVVVSAASVPPASLLSPTGLISFPLTAPTALHPNAVVVATAEQIPPTTAAAQFTSAVLSAQFPPNALFAAQPSAAVPYIDEMKLKDFVRAQIEYYFSADNLQKDFFLRRKMDHEGFLPLSLVASFPRVRSLTLDQSFIVESLYDSEKVEMNEDNQKIRPRMNPQQWPLLESATHTGTENSPTIATGAEKTDSEDLEQEQQQKLEGEQQQLSKEKEGQTKEGLSSHLSQESSTSNGRQNESALSVADSGREKPKGVQQEEQEEWKEVRTKRSKRSNRNSAPIDFLIKFLISTLENPTGMACPTPSSSTLTTTAGDQLTEEQKERIKQNRERALRIQAEMAEQRRKQQQQAVAVQVPSVGVASTQNKPTTSALEARYGRFPATCSVPHSFSTKGFNSQSPRQMNSTQKVFVHVEFSLLSANRFKVQFTPFNIEVVDKLKSIPSRTFNPDDKTWSFHIDEYEITKRALNELNRSVNLTLIEIPFEVIKLFLDKSAVKPKANITKIGQHLLDSLFPFQRSGVSVGIERDARLLMADEMGLGKSVQALAISNYYRNEWPLLVVCPSSVKYAWVGQFKRFMPDANVYVIERQNDPLPISRNTSVAIILSYDLMVSKAKQLKSNTIYVAIFDESHLLKEQTTKRAKVAFELSKIAHRVLLLSGTPALSRPSELFTQIRMINPNIFPNWIKYATRYCEGRKGRFGFEAKGRSNPDELKTVMDKIMIRRLKKDVLDDLPEKRREVVYLSGDAIDAKIRELKKAREACEQANRYSDAKKKKEKFTAYYVQTGIVKMKAVAEHVVDTYFHEGAAEKKVLVFAHHMAVLDTLGVAFARVGIQYIRIDGTTPARERALYCEQFQTDSRTMAALLSITAAGTGITLTSASVVVFAELYWNPSLMIQAEDRAHRVGQKDSVHVQYLLARKTVDMDIWALLGSKLKVLGEVNLSNETYRGIENTEKFCGSSTLITDFFNVMNCDDGCGGDNGGAPTAKRSKTGAAKQQND
uniref:Uncharacterized protein n=1 Tax=Globodera rostochiensis TaxID=31243 RepID=A0A914HB61_GLORO